LLLLLLLMLMLMLLLLLLLLPGSGKTQKPPASARLEENNFDTYRVSLLELRASLNIPKYEDEEIQLPDQRIRDVSRKKSPSKERFLLQESASKSERSTTLCPSGKINLFISLTTT